VRVSDAEQNNGYTLWAKPQAGNIWRRLEQITFGAFVGGLVALLALL
jgi:hypothetical protein